MNKPESGIFWKKATFCHTCDGEGAYTFKFMEQQNWGNQWSPTSNDLEINVGSINTNGYYLCRNTSTDNKFKTVTTSGDRNVVCDFVSEANPKMYIYPSDYIYLDMGGTRYAMAWNESTGNYTCTTEIPASTTFRFSMNSDGTGTFGAATANTVIGIAANDNAKIVRNGTNYYTTPANKKITGLTLHLATRQLTITSVDDDSAGTTYTVTFNSDGGTSVASQVVAENGKASRPADPTKDDYTFSYWKLSGGSTEYDFNTAITADITLVAVWTPIVYYTVTVHPNNGGDNIVHDSNVPEGSNSSASVLNLSSITYGNGTATWYTDAACTTPFTTVTADMDLYAKWGISGQAWLVGDLWMYDNSNFSGGLGANPEMTVTNGVATYTYIAPAGKNRLEAYRNGDGDWWNRKISGESTTNTSSGLSWSEGVMQFTLDAPKKVTITYNGKFSLAMEDYTFTSANWRVTCDGWDGNSSWSHTTALDATGHATIRNVNPGTHLFKITQGLTQNSEGLVGEKVFNALYVDTSSPSSGLTWASETTNYGRTGVPQEANGNQYRNCKFTLANDANAINGKYDVRITFDGGVIRCDILPKYTVTFNSNGGSAVAAQTLFEGRKATEPTAPTRDGYIFNGWKVGSTSGDAYDFDTPVTDDITLVATWEYKPITAVSLDESTHTTWVGNNDFTLTPTLDPNDGITNTTVWSSSKTDVATVSNGTVHAVAAGTAVITYTVTDQYDTERSASCTVTVAACQMTTDNLYSMTVTGYNTSTGHDATLAGLWNESTDNDCPATFRIVKLKLSNNYYVYDDNGTVKMSTDASLATAQWYEIPTGESYSPNWTGSNFSLYEFKNVSTGNYMRRGNGRYGSNGDWYYYTTLADSRTIDGNQYKFFYDNTKDTHLVCREGADYNEGNTVNELKKAFAIHNNNLNWADGYSGYCATPMVVCGYTNDPSGNTYTKLHETVIVNASYPNPAYLASQMNSTYYRMNTDATITATLDNPLRKHSVITVSLYADAATTVQLQKTDGTHIATIDLSADTPRDFTYTVEADSPLLGQSAFVIKATDNHSAIASIVVTRSRAAHPSETTDFAWDSDLSAGINQSTLGAPIVHTATSSMNEGAVTYESSNEGIATVDADGTVHPIMAGDVTITATIEEEGCYAENTISYNIHLTEPLLSELIDADNGTGITLTHNYAEDIVIDKAVTIDGDGHSIGNLTVENSGNLTLSGALTVTDFTLHTNAGNIETSAASGQVHGVANLTVSGNAYFEYAMDPDAVGGAAQDWYAFTVPFPVDANSGIARYEGGEGNWNTRSNLNTALRPEQHYAIMRYRPEVRAQGQYGWKKYYGTLQPGEMYLLTTNHYYNIYRFRMIPGSDLSRSNVRALQSYPASGEGIEIRDANWNALGNNMLYHAEAQGVTAQVVQWLPGGGTSFIAVETNENAFVVGTAFAIKQGTGELTMATNSSSPLLAPARRTAQQASGRYTVQIAPQGRTYTDQLFVSASDEATGSYNEATDVPKMGSIGTATVPQLWVNAYDTRLCANQAVLTNGSADFDLGLSAPTAGSYTLSVAKQPEDGSQLWLTLNDALLWNLTISDYTLVLNQGNTSTYGLRIIVPANTPTGLDGRAAGGESAVKYLRDGQIYILRGGVEHDILGR